MAFTSHQQPSSISANESLTCGACKVIVSSHERNSHYRSDWHRYNVKRKCVSMPPIEKKVFEDKLKSIIASGREINSMSKRKKKTALNKKIQKNYDTLISNDKNLFSQNKAPVSLLTYSCTLCSKTFKTHQQCLSHLNTKKHKIAFIKHHKNLRNQSQQINAPTDSQITPLNKLEPIKTIQNNPFISIKQKKQKQHKKRKHIETNIDDESKEDTNKHKNHKIRKSIPSSQCLFCTMSSENTESCLEHMMRQHGFFIPLPRLINLKELLTTAGEIVGKYYQCVWCWKIFKSLKAVRLHMIDKTHCKLQMDYSSNVTYSMSEKHYVENENDNSPFLKYFDFNKVIVDIVDDNGNKNRELMHINKPHITDINECDELVRSDGTIIGHRDNLVIYKQKHKHLSRYHETQTEEQIIAQINNPQRKFQLQEIEKQKRMKAFQQSGAIQQLKNDKIKDNDTMNLQGRQHKVNLQNWKNLQKSRQLSHT